MLTLIQKNINSVILNDRKQVLIFTSHLTNETNSTETTIKTLIRSKIQI